MEVDIKQYLRESNNIKPIAKIVLLHNEDESEWSPFETKVIDGNINIIKANGVRRSCSLTIENVDGEFFLRPTHIWVRQKFKIYLGYDVLGDEYWFPQGVFIMSDVSYNDAGGNKTASIEGIDKFSLLDGQLSGTLQGTYSVALGTQINTAMRTLLSEVGDPQYPILDIPDTDLTPYTLYTEVGGTYSDTLIEMNNMIAYNMYYDEDGVFRCEPETLDIQKPSLWNYTTAEFHYQGGTRSISTRNVYNAVKVIGNNVNGNLATGYAENINPESDFSVDRLGGVPIVKVISDQVIPTDAYAQGRAEYELKKLMALYSEVSFQSTQLYFLDVNNIVTITSANLDLARERFLITSLTIPFFDKISLNVVKASDLNFS